MKQEPTEGYLIIGKNKKGLYTSKTAYALHYLSIYMMMCTIFTTVFFIGLLVEVIIK